MATSWSEYNLSCCVCLDIFKEPVQLPCDHNFCRACLQSWWSENTNLECPLCKRKSSLPDPPLNLALKTQCEAFLLEEIERRNSTEEEKNDEGLCCCCLQRENLRLFCLDCEKAICVKCGNSETHGHHSVMPIDEIVQDYKEGLVVMLQPLREKLGFFRDVRQNVDQTAQEIEIQTQDTERQIRDFFSTLQKILQTEEGARIAALKDEYKEKSEIIKSRSEDLSKEIAAVTDTVRGTEEVLRAEDHSFLQRYKTAAQVVHCFQSNEPRPIPEAQIDFAKHLQNISFEVFEKLKNELIPATPSPTASVATAASQGVFSPRVKIRERRPSFDADFCAALQSKAGSKMWLFPKLRRRSWSLERLSIDQQTSTDRFQYCPATILAARERTERVRKNLHVKS